MTAEPAQTPRVVTFLRAEHPQWVAGYWDQLVGVKVRMPAVLEAGRMLAGYLVEARETTDTIELTFSDLVPEASQDF